MKCQHCDEEVLPDESHRLSPQFHPECIFRLVSGSVAHIRKECSCFGGTVVDLDPPDMTKRQAAREALRVWRELHPYLTDEKPSGGHSEDS